MNIVFCPVCHNQIKLKTYVNSFLEPKEKQKILNRIIFDYECPECGETMCTKHHIVYHDVKNKAIVCYKPDGFKEIEKIKEKIQLFQYSIVNTVDEFIEQIMILDAGLDNYTVNLLKRDFYEKIKEKRKISINNIFFFVEAGILFFHCIYDDNDDEICEIGGVFYG